MSRKFRNHSDQVHCAERAKEARRRRCIIVRQCRVSSTSVRFRSLQNFLESLSSGCCSLFCGLVRAFGRLLLRLANTQAATGLCCGGSNSLSDPRIRQPLRCLAGICQCFADSPTGRWRSYGHRTVLAVQLPTHKRRLCGGGLAGRPALHSPWGKRAVRRDAGTEHSRKHSALARHSIAIAPHGAPVAALSGGRGVFDGVHLHMA